MVIVNDHCTARHRGVFTVGDYMLWRDYRVWQYPERAIVWLELGYDTTVAVVASTHHRLLCEGISQPVPKQSSLAG